MATTEALERGRVWIGWIAAALVGLVGAVWLVSCLQRPPQMGADEEAFRSVDALFTAVGMRDEKKLAECERRLHTLRETGKLPPRSAKRLDRIIERARRGEWEDASQSLYDFMRAQRRQPE